MINETVFADEKRSSREFLRRDLFGLGLLAVGSLGFGCAVNALRSQPLPLIYTSPQDRLGAVVARMSAKSSTGTESTPANVPWQDIGLGEFQEFVSSHKGISIDARARIFYQQGHIPGAVNLPREDFEGGYARVRTLLEPAKERPIIVYCSEADCRDSELVASALGRLGYRHLLVYKEGWEEWLRAGLPQETNSSPCAWHPAA